MQIVFIPEWSLEVEALHTPGHTPAHMSWRIGDAVFLGDKLQPVADALGLSKRARAAIEQNLWISTIYNVIAVPIAVAGFVTPLMAAVAMSASSLAVTANALKLRWGEKRLKADGTDDSAAPAVAQG